MITGIYVNLPVKDLKKSMDFFSKLGFTFNPQFTNEQAAGMEIGDKMYAMLLSEPFLKTFTTREMADTSKSIEVMVALSVENREQVDEIVNKALAAGATAPQPTEDDFMYSRSFEDMDGHRWDVFFMDLSKMPQA
jgi:uncharacterized protein